MANVEQLNDYFGKKIEKKEITVKEPLENGGSATVYEIIYGEEKQALKVIDILDLAGKELEKTGANEEDDRQSVKDHLLEQYENEIEVNKNITASRCEHLLRVRNVYISGRESKEVCFCALRMPYYETLETLHRKEPIDEKTVIRLGSHICEALSVLHHDPEDEYFRAPKYRMGVMLHMDIKPANIFYRQEGDDKIFMLGDFGTLVDKSAGEIIGGTVGYLAPELTAWLTQSSDSKESEMPAPTESADIFSLGMTLLYCLVEKRSIVKEGEKTTTEKYWTAKCNGLLVKKPVNCSKQLWKVIEKATSKDPAMRYQTAKEMQSALQNVDAEKAEVAIRENKKLKIKNVINTGIIMVGGIFTLVQALDRRAEKKQQDQNEKLNDVCDKEETQEQIEEQLPKDGEM